MKIKKGRGRLTSVNFSPCSQEYQKSASMAGLRRPEQNPSELLQGAYLQIFATPTKFFYGETQLVLKELEENSLKAGIPHNSQ